MLAVDKNATVVERVEKKHGGLLLNLRKPSDIDPGPHGVLQPLRETGSRERRILTELHEEVEVGVTALVAACR